MDQQKPLSYQCLKTVIQYMDSSFRLIRSCQIASLRKIQKVVPLRLGVLELNDSTFTLDNIGYRYLHCGKYTKDGGPETALFSGYDLNNDGGKEIFEDLMPGDIVIKYRGWPDFSPDDEKLISDSYVLCNVWTGLSNQYLECHSQYGMKIRDMMRKTLHKVLGGKRSHQVQHLKIGVYNGVLRLPKGLKLKIQELSIEDNSMAVIDAILTILDVSSFPLKSLSIQLKNPEDSVVQSEILRSSESLNIRNWGSFDNSWANLLINLPNMKIHLKNEIPLNDIVLIIRNWMKRPRVIGTRLSMQSISIKEYFYEIEKEFKAVEGVFHKRKCSKPVSCLTLPMTSTSELNIYEPQSTNDEEELKKRSGKHYMIVIQVMPIGTAKPLKHQ